MFSRLFSAHSLFHTYQTKERPKYETLHCLLTIAIYRFVTKPPKYVDYQVYTKRRAVWDSSFGPYQRIKYQGKLNGSGHSNQILRLAPIPQIDHFFHTTTEGLREESESIVIAGGAPVTSPGTVTCHQVWTTCHLVPPPRNTNTHRNFRKALSPSIIGIPLFIPVSLQHITQPAFCCVKLLLKGLQSLNISQTVCTVSSNNF